MGKLLFWLVLIAAGYLALRLVAISQRRREAARRAAQDPARGAAAGPDGADRIGGEMMVRCAHCGVFLPASDAFVDGGRSYCDRDHRDADRIRQRHG